MIHAKCQTLAEDVACVAEKIDKWHYSITANIEHSVRVWPEIVDKTFSPVWAASCVIQGNV